MATSFTLELVEQQLVFAKDLTDIFVEPPSKATPVAPTAPNVITVNNGAQTLVTAADDTAQELIATAQALAKRADDAIQARVETADDDAPTFVRTTDEDQQIELRAERLVIDKQRVQHGEARVRKEIVTEMKSINVPVSYEELVIERHAVTGDADVDGAPIADETIRIPLTEEKINIAKETVVREEVEIGKRRVDDIEHISDTVRHEELRVDDSTTNPGTPRVNPEQLVTTPDDAAPALVTTPNGAAPSLVTTANDAAPGPVTTTEDDQEIELRAERLVVNKQRVQNGKARVRKEIVTEKKSIDVPVSHEELVIDRHAVSGDVDVDVDSAPIADETIRIPLGEDNVNIAKQTVVAEEVEIGKRRVEDVEHISDTVRHEELHVDDSTTNHNYEPAF